MKHKTQKWFTLVELLISMTIFFIFVVMTYVNYSYYQNISKVKLSLKQISQTINDARNLAISWYNKDWINQSIWVYFDLENDKNNISLYAINYNSWIILNNNSFYKKISLQPWIWIDNISWKNKILIYFSSIYAKPEIYYYDNSWVANIFSWDYLDFDISFKWALTFPLNRKLKYFKNTNVVDY